MSFLLIEWSHEEYMNTETIKEVNISKIIDFLREVPNSTIAEISRSTLLSIATCSNIMNELLKDGEVFESGLNRRSGGRPAKEYSINPDHFHICCLQLYVYDQIDHMVYFTSNRMGETINSSEPIPGEVTVNTLKDTISEIIKDDPLITSIGIGVPGLVYKGNVGSDCDNARLRNTNLLQELSDTFYLQIFIENDMNLCALGSYYFYLDSGINTSMISVVNFPKNDCIGVGTAKNGNVIQGMSSFSGELSYLPLPGVDEKRHLRPNNGDELINTIMTVALVVITTYNPSILTFTGNLVIESVFEEVVRLCAEHIPHEHMPRFEFKKDILYVYKLGLLKGTLKNAERRTEWVEV